MNKGEGMQAGALWDAFELLCGRADGHNGQARLLLLGEALTVTVRIVTVNTEALTSYLSASRTPLVLLWGSLLVHTHPSRSADRRLTTYRLQRTTETLRAYSVRAVDRRGGWRGAGCVSMFVCAACLTTGSSLCRLVGPVLILKMNNTIAAS